MFPELFSHVKPRTNGALSDLIWHYLAYYMGRRPDRAVALARPKNAVIPCNANAGIRYPCTASRIYGRTEFPETAFVKVGDWTDMAEIGQVMQVVTCRTRSNRSFTEYAETRIFELEEFPYFGKFVCIRLR